MRFNQRHLTIALAVLVASVIYNIWVFTRSAPSTPGRQGPLLQNTAAVVAPPGETDAALDPAKIPAPPPVDLDKAPAWGRDPFVNLARVDPPPSPAPSLGPDPAVHSILFSAGRRAALVDGRVVGVGDQVRNGTVVAIDRDAIVVRTPAGDQRRVGLRASAALGGISR